MKALPVDIAQPAAEAGLSPLDYMLLVMRDEAEDPQRRDRMAMAAAPFVHVRALDARPGKKDEAAAKAKQVAGRFVASAPPKLIVAGGKKVGA